MNHGKLKQVIYNLAFLIFFVILKSLKKIGENKSLFFGLIKGASSFKAVSKVNSDLDEELSIIYLYILLYSKGSSNEKEKLSFNDTFLVWTILSFNNIEALKGPFSFDKKEKILFLISIPKGSFKWFILKL